MMQETIQPKPELQELVKSLSVKGIIYDFDGLLADTEPMWYEIFRSSLEDFDISLEESEWNQYVGMGNLSQVFIDRYELKISRSDMNDKIGKLLYPIMATNLQAMPGAVENVQTLAPYFPMGVASSSYTEYVKKGLQYLGVENAIQIVVGGDTVSNTKPAPDVFLKAAKALELDPSEILVFEDSYNGMLAAKAAGAKCIVIPSNTFAFTTDFSRADLIIPKFDVLSEYLLAMPSK